MYQLIYAACANADYGQIHDVIGAYFRKRKQNNIDSELFWIHAIDGAFKSNKADIIQLIIKQCDMPLNELINIMLLSNIDTPAARMTLIRVIANGNSCAIDHNRFIINNDKVMAINHNFGHLPLSDWFIFMERLLMKYDYEYTDIFTFEMRFRLDPQLTQDQITHISRFMALNGCVLYLHKLRQYIDDCNIESKSHTELSINWRECLYSAMKNNHFDVVQYIISFNYPLISDVIHYSPNRVYYDQMDNNHYKRKQIVDYACRLLKQMPKYLQPDGMMGYNIYPLYEFNNIDVFKMINLNQVSRYTLRTVFTMSMCISDEYIATAIYHHLKDNITNYDIEQMLASYRKKNQISAISLLFRLTNCADLLDISETQYTLNQGIQIDNEHVNELNGYKALLDLETAACINDYGYDLCPLYDRNIANIICSYDEFRYPETFK